MTMPNKTDQPDSLLFVGQAPDTGRAQCGLSLRRLLGIGYWESPMAQPRPRNLAETCEHCFVPARSTRWAASLLQQAASPSRERVLDRKCPASRLQPAQTKKPRALAGHDEYKFGGDGGELNSPSKERLPRASYRLIRPFRSYSENLDRRSFPEPADWSLTALIDVWTAAPRLIGASSPPIGGK